MSSQNACSLTGNYYSETDKCRLCHRQIGKHFLINGLCKECYVDMTTLDDLKKDMVIPICG